MASVLYSKVYFFSDGAEPNIKNRKKLRAFIIHIFKKEKIKLGAINFVFTTDQKLLKINKDYLSHDFLTDIITFDLSESHNPIVAEVYISLERVRENALKLGESISSEIHRVIFHGALHLCGYSDKTKIQSKKMRELENYYLSEYFNRCFT